MTFDEIIVHTRDILNFNPNQVNADFTDAQIKRAINFCLSAEIDRMKHVAHPAYFLAYQDFTWAAGAETQALPLALVDLDHIAFYDITSDSTGPGVKLGLMWEDRETLRWGSSAPSNDRTIRCVYYARPQKLVGGSDVPTLLPPEYHEILGWSAAIYMRRMADEEAPMQWLAYLEERRIDLTKRLSRRPAGTPNRILQAVFETFGLDT